MQPTPLNVLPSPLAAWTGHILSVSTIAILLADAAVNLFAPELIRAEIESSGFSVEHAPKLGLIILACAIFYTVPRTAVLGAILLTGFLGGAICVHFRLGDLGSPAQITALLIGAMAWGGLYLRDLRLRALLPFTASADKGRHPNPTFA